VLGPRAQRTRRISSSALVGLLRSGGMTAILRQLS
jgi:hypothetical protein